MKSKEWFIEEMREAFEILRKRSSHAPTNLYCPRHGWIMKDGKNTEAASICFKEHVPICNTIGKN